MRIRGLRRIIKNLLYYLFMATACSAFFLRSFRKPHQRPWCRKASSLQSYKWYGIIAPFSEYADHVLVGDRDAPVSVEDSILRSMADKVIHRNASLSTTATTRVPLAGQPMTPTQLLRLGSVWMLPKDMHEHNQLQIAHSSYKPIRLVESNATMILHEGDYLRIHYNPRRFPAVQKFDWQEWQHSSTSLSLPELPPVIVKSSPEYWIINKPPLVPVHATVDNAVENVIAQLSLANPRVDYVAAAQRLDINTSGLMVIAKKNEFAAYFAQLLRHKTKGKDGGQKCIAKRYKCLVCVKTEDDKKETILQAWNRLKTLQNETIRHFLEPSDRAPKRFEREPPPLPLSSTNDSNHDEAGKWLECLLRITNVSQLHPIPDSQHPLVAQLWTSATMPSNVKAICEVSIELQTGRTHQIRGQLSQLGFPLVGDEQYGGAIPIEDDVDDDDGSPKDPQILALQSSYVGFLEPDYAEEWNKKRKKMILQGKQSERWVEVSLDEAWWTPILQVAGSSGKIITSSKDADLVQALQDPKSTFDSEWLQSPGSREHPELLPPRVQLEPGRNKYVLVKVECDNGKQLWFVKSASPKSCGGPYHVNVAAELIEWIQAAGYEKVTVTGGGRIDYSPTSNRANVFGFSYGFGKGDHARAVALISDTGCLATYDNSDTLY